jgi:hypothetical protein
VRQLTDVRGRPTSLDWSLDGERLLFRLTNPPADSRVCFYTFTTNHTTCLDRLTNITDTPTWQPVVP